MGRAHAPGGREIALGGRTGRPRPDEPVQRPHHAARDSCDRGGTSLIAVGPVRSRRPPAPRGRRGGDCSDQPIRKWTRSRGSVISFTSEKGAKFKCKLDKAKFKPCTSPYKVKAKSKRGNGKKHTISVKATDEAGNVGKAATVRFKVIRKGYSAARLPTPRRGQECGAEGGQPFESRPTLGRGSYTNPLRPGHDLAPVAGLLSWNAESSKQLFEATAAPSRGGRGRGLADGILRDLCMPHLKSSPPNAGCPQRSRATCCLSGPAQASLQDGTPGPIFCACVITLDKCRSIRIVCPSGGAAKGERMKYRDLALPRAAAAPPAHGSRRASAVAQSPRAGRGSS